MEKGRVRGRPHWARSLCGRCYTNSYSVYQRNESEVEEIISENYHWLSFGCSLTLFVLRLRKNFLDLFYGSLQSRHFHIQPIDLPF
jgi:hypothetical protein